MIIDKLAQELHEEQEFKNIYEVLLQKELDVILNLSELREKLEENQLDILLESGIIFATVGDENTEASKFHDLAYRIAILLKHHYPEYAEQNEEALYVIFSRLGRYPIAKQFFMGKQNDIHQALPLLLFGPTEFAKELNTVEIGKSQYVLTNFQKNFWDRIHKNKQVAVCAPTSAGKSFILSQFTVSEYHASSDSFIAVYIVPTNALINEVSDNIIACSYDNFEERPNIYTTSVLPSEVRQNRAIYVLTQEKLASLLAKANDNEDDNFLVNLLVVDEAQIIADGERGGITKSVIEDVLANNDKTHIILGSPPVQNLEGYAKFFELKELSTYPETISPVAKNLVRIFKISGSTKKFDLLAKLGDTELEIKSLEIKDISLQNIAETLASFAREFGAGEPSLIYASIPSDCIKTAKNLVSYNACTVPEDKAQTAEEFSKFICDYIHPEFALAEYVTQGVAFHFGALPLIVTKQLEKKFRERTFSYLVSTSTLLHGVNLPAKNLFLCRPKKGRSDALDDIEFWNLVGRAGRLGKDFQGNVFVIEDRHETEDITHWSSEYLVNEGKQTIESALDKCLRMNPEIGKSELSVYLEDVLNEKIPEASKTLENIFSQLLYYQRKGRLTQSLARSSLEIEDEELSFVLDAFKKISEKISVSSEILNKHRYISPIRIQALYQRLSELAEKGEMHGRIPLHPRDNTDSQSFNNLFTIFRSLCKQFGVGGHHKRQKALASIAFKWMEGENFNVLAKEYVENSDFGSENPTTKIYNFFRELQTTISYEYSKYMRCYIDVLQLVNRETTKPFLHGEGAKIAPLHSYLEEGTYIQSQLALIKCGLSRMTAIEVYNILEPILGQSSTLEETRNIVSHRSGLLKDHLHPYFYEELQNVFGIN